MQRRAVQSKHVSQKRGVNVKSIAADQKCTFEIFCTAEKISIAKNSVKAKTIAADQNRRVKVTFAILCALKGKLVLQKKQCGSESYCSKSIED